MIRILLPSDFLFFADQISLCRDLHVSNASHINEKRDGIRVVDLVFFFCLVHINYGMAFVIISIPLTIEAARFLVTYFEYLCLVV